MSNLLNYASIGKRLWESVSVPYNWDTFTALDGSVWKHANPKTLTYSSTYSALLTDCPTMVTSAVNMNWPFAGGLWDINQSLRCIIGGSTWLLLTYDTTFYWTSTDSGSTWTSRSLPVAGKTLIWLWDWTNFVLYAPSSTTDWVQESTDGITWTTRTAISLGAIRDLVYNGSVYLAVSSWIANCATSSDRITWTSRTCITTSNQSPNPWNWFVTWNAGAWLFIMWTQTAHTYQTSPDGITWTSRTTPHYLTATNTCLYASNSIVTVAFSSGGKLATTTDGINWTERSLPVESSFISGIVPAACYHDWTRFVWIIAGFVFYSTDGTTWQRSARANIQSTAIGTIIKTPTGIINSVQWQYVLHLTNPASTSTTNIITQVVSAIGTPNVLYCRIL